MNTYKTAISNKMSRINSILNVNRNRIPESIYALISIFKIATYLRKKCYGHFSILLRFNQFFEVAAWQALRR